jgi:TPR repeat protein
MHMNGLGVPRNASKARGYFEAAAKENVPAAFTALGYMYYKGVGVPRNVSAGEAWLRRGADAGDPQAAFDLAALYQALPRAPHPAPASGLTSV